MNMRTLIRLVTVALLGAATALLVSCGSSGKGLIPSANAGPLQNDFEEVARAAESGNGSCAATESALGKTEQDFLALPTTIDKGLHRRLEEGIKHLRKQALEMCTEPTPTATSTTSTETTTTPTTSTETTSTETATTPSTTPSTPTSTQTTPSTGTPQNPGGGVEAPEEGSGEGGVGEQGAGVEGAGGNGASNSGGASAGGAQ
jgi:cobalamin biosynthesis Mg chelatase CobN